MSIPTRFEDFNSSDHQNFGGSNSDLAKGAVERHRAELRAARIAKTSRRAELRHREPPSALRGRDDLDAMYTAPPPAPPPAPVAPSAQELVDRVAADHQILKAEVVALAKSLGRVV